jgi:hypothetical protein
MMGTLAGWLARKGIATPEESYWAQVEGDIENINGVLKITQIRVDYHLKVGQELVEVAREAFGSYLGSCPAAQSVIGCIDIKDNLIVQE